MIMIAGRRKVQKDGHMQIVCHTSGNLRPMNWVGVHFIFRLPLYIFILGAPHPFNPGSPRNDQPHRPNIGQTVSVRHHRRFLIEAGILRYSRFL